MQEKLINVLKYIGIIGATICSVAYIFVVIVLIQGFEAETTTQTVIFAVVNAIVGFIIMQFLKVQGEQFAKNKPENKKIIDEYKNKAIFKRNILCFNTINDILFQMKKMQINNEFDNIFIWQ